MAFIQFYIPYIMDCIRRVFKRAPSSHKKTVRRSISMPFPSEWPSHLDIIDIRAGAEARSIDDLSSIFPRPPSIPPPDHNYDARQRSMSVSTGSGTTVSATRTFVYVHPPSPQSDQSIVASESELDVKPRPQLNSRRSLKDSLRHLKRSASRKNIARKPQAHGPLEMPTVTTVTRKQYSRWSKPLPPLPRPEVCAAF